MTFCVYTKGNVLLDDGFAKVDFVTLDGKIVAFGKAHEGGKFDATEFCDDILKFCSFKENCLEKHTSLVLKDATTVDCSQKFAIPRLIDIHMHGAVGFDFNTADSRQMAKILEFCSANGVGSLLPTIMTDSVEVLCRQLSRVAEVSKHFDLVKGIHLEGPFLSQKFRGAMPKQFLREIDFELFEKFQKSADGLIKLVTIAPELDNAVEFVKHLKKQNVAVSLGHSDADFCTTMKCVEVGAKSFTHTFNAMRQLTKFEPAIVGAALASDSFCEVIPDGKHIDGQIVNLIVKTKGIEKVIAITDSIMATGMPDGQYYLGINEVVVKDGDAKIVGTDTRAGSTLLAIDGVKNMMKFANLTLAQATKTMTQNPAKMLGIFDKVGSIALGKNADILLLDIDKFN